MSQRNTELMLLAREGDDHAFDRLMEQNRSRVLNLVYRFIGSRHEAEDLAQEVFLKIYRSRKRYEPRARFSTWLYRITANLCLNFRRDATRRDMLKISTLEKEGERAQGILDPRSERPDLHQSREEIRKQVREALHQLPENQRMAIILAKYENLSYREIAEIVDSTEKAIKSLLHRARTTLRHKLDRIINDP